MQAKDVMRREVFTIGEDEPVADLVDVLIREHIHGMPVVNAEGRLRGVVTQQDIFMATVTQTCDPDMTVGEIMTSPAVSADEQTDLFALSRMMVRLRIHRVPIVRYDKVTGIISSLDICGAFARGAVKT